MAESAESVYNLTHDPSGLVWVAHSGTDVVPDAVYAGKETNGRQVYVARSLNNGYLWTGKFVPGFGMYILYYGKEVKEDSFQVLTNPSNDLVQTKWALFEGRIPPTAVKGGFLPTGSANTWEYIGRTKHEGNAVVGYVVTCDVAENQPLIQLYYSLNGKDGSCTDFEILLAKNRHDSQCPRIFQLDCGASCPKKKL